MWKSEGKTLIYLYKLKDFLCCNCMVGYKSPFKARERKENPISRNHAELHNIVTSGCKR